MENKTETGTKVVDKKPKAKGEKVATASIDPESGLLGGYPKYLHDKLNAFVFFTWIAAFLASLGCLILLLVDYSQLNPGSSLPESHLTASLFMFLLSAIFFLFFLITFVRYQSNKPKIIAYSKEAHTVLCPKCHGENKIGARVCIHCGADLLSSPIASENGYPHRPYGVVLKGLFYQDYFTPVFFSTLLLVFLILTILGFAGFFPLGATIFYLSFAFVLLLVSLYHFLLVPLKYASPKEDKKKKHAYHYYSDRLEEVTIVKTKKGEKKIESELYFKDALKAKKIKNYYVFVGKGDRGNLLFFLDETKLPKEYISILDEQMKEIISLNGK